MVVAVVFVIAAAWAVEAILGNRPPPMQPPPERQFVSAKFADPEELARLGLYDEQ